MYIAHMYSSRDIFSNERLFYILKVFLHDIFKMNHLIGILAGGIFRGRCFHTECLQELEIIQTHTGMLYMAYN